MIEIFFDDVKVPGLDSELFVLWLNEVITSEKFECGDVNLIFVSDEKLLEMNQQFLQHDYYTDIITFDYSADKIISGELYISIDRVNENALEMDGYDNEIKRVCVHGVLHLCGYGDKSDEEIVEIRSKENFYINRFVSRETN
jgi:probable rRNA maturation factor